MSKPLTKREAIAELSTRFQHSGHVRQQDIERLKEFGYMRYKKGDEVRLAARTEQELVRIQELLRCLDISFGKPFAKGRGFCQPIYGREQVKHFLSLIGFTFA
jgi:hypothetical protein